MGTKGEVWRQRGNAAMGCFARSVLADSPTTLAQVAWLNAPAGGTQCPRAAGICCDATPAGICKNGALYQRGDAVMRRFARPQRGKAAMGRFTRRQRGKTEIARFSRRQRGYAMGRLIALAERRARGLCVQPVRSADP